MISKQDVLLLLTDLKKTLPETDSYIKTLYADTSVPLETLRFISDHRSLDISAFYNKLKKAHNEKKSKLYINIMKSDESELNADEILTTLSSYLNQVFLFSKGIENKEMFFRNSRVEEVISVLNEYFKNYDIEKCMTLLSLIKADIKVFEYLKTL